MVGAPISALTHEFDFKRRRRNAHEESGPTACGRSDDQKASEKPWSVPDFSGLDLSRRRRVSHSRKLTDFECEMARLVCTTHVTRHDKTTAICEVGVMPLTMKEVYFIAG